MSVEQTVDCHALIAGDATGELLVSEVGLSFWGGVDPVSGTVIDQHHPLSGESLQQKILVIPSGRGSCSGSGVMLELLHNNVAPAALMFTEAEDILTLGVLTGQVLFNRYVPVYQIDRAVAVQLQSGMSATIEKNQLGGPGVRAVNMAAKAPSTPKTQSTTAPQQSHLKLSDGDRHILDGGDGKAAQLALQIVVKMAELQGATELIDVTQAHIDACVYSGPSNLMFAERLVSLGGKVRVPTTLNALSVDKQRWRRQGVNSEFGEAASALGDAYVAMGAVPSFTCAPYLLDSAPVQGEQIVWAESNAVAYANSVIGARTQKYPDFLDICIALTARAPKAGPHLDGGRLPTTHVHVCTDNSPSGKGINVAVLDDSFWPLLGYHIGAISSNDIPFISGLEALSPTPDEHKAFSAAFATTSSVAMFHIAGQTPEASNPAVAVAVSGHEATMIEIDALIESWHELNSATSSRVDMVCFGNPHFSLTECKQLAELCAKKNRHATIPVIVTLGRDVHAQAEAAGYTEALTRFGAQFMNDTCWCMIEEPVIPPGSTVLMTNSGKYAHYGPGLVERAFHFGSMAECVETACSGTRQQLLPAWLQVNQRET